MKIILTFLICTSGGVCEEHTVDTPVGSMMECMLTSQATIAKSFPLRGDQQVKNITCSTE
jgi:hypothetical protein